MVAITSEELADLRAHEQVHVQQYERWGPAFLFASVASSAWQLLRGRDPYWHNHFEIDARRGSRRVTGTPDALAKVAPHLEPAMSDNSSIRSGSDRERINVHQDHELRHWAKKFDATPEQIKEAVQAVGDRADKVEMHLKGSRSTTNSDREERGG